MTRRLEKDRTIKVPEAQLIADKFTGQAKKYSSKPKAINAMGPQISGLF